MDRHVGTTFEPPVPLDSTQVDALAEFNALGRRIIWREPMDALRPGFRIEGEGLDPVLERKAYRWLARRFQLIAALKKARAFARATGGAAIVIVAADGRTPDQPLDLAGLQRVHRLVVKDRFEIFPELIVLDPESPYYGTSEHYQVAGGTKAFRVHASRVVRFDGLPLSDRSSVIRNGWGGSVFDLIFAELRNYGSSYEDAAEAVGLLTQGIFEIADYGELINTGRGDQIEARYAAMRMGLGTLGDIVLDAGKEKYTLQSRSFAGLDALLAKFLEAVIAATDMPEVILRGNRSAGLNGGSGGDDLRGWYDLCGSERADHYESQVLDLLLVLLSDPESPTGGLVPADLGVDWPAMWAPTEAEAATVRVQRATARASDIAAQIIDPTEARTDADLGEYYTLGETVTPHAPPTRTLEPDEIDGLITDEAAIPPGEIPISATEAARKMGYASASPILAMIRSERIRVWRASAGSPYRVLISEVAREMHTPIGAATRTAAVEPPAHA